MACDVCGKVRTSLTDLREEFQTDDIKAVCPDCENAINNQHRKITVAVLKIRTDWLRRFIRNRKEQHHDNQD